MSECVGHKPEERLLPERRERRLRPGPQRDDRRIHARHRPERASRYAPNNARFGERLNEDREIAPLARVPSGRGHPSRDLLLDEHDDERRPSRVGKEPLEEGRGDLVGKVRDDPRDRPRGDAEKIDREGIRPNDLDVLVLGECLFEERDHTRIHLDCGHRPDPSGEGGGQDARPRPHLEDIVVRREPGCIDDRSEHGAVDEEALSE